MQCSGQITLNYVYLSFKYWKILIIFYWKMFHFLPEKSNLILTENYLFYWKILIKKLDRLFTAINKATKWVIENS